MLEKKLAHGYETSRRNGIEIEIENEQHTCDDDNALVVVLNCNHYWSQLTTEDHRQAKKKKKKLARIRNIGDKILRNLMNRKRFSMKKFIHLKGATLIEYRVNRKNNFSITRKLCVRAFSRKCKFFAHTIDVN